ncbi:hypothetical protein JTB14_002203 [Gonioctena quinquepunctata]|nr:hypothetical protein JTB14_002203 [Gonioctena quinquepunctata]
MKKYGMENISSLSTNNSIVGLENISPSAFSSLKEVSNGKENENFNHRDYISSRNLFDVDYSLARTSPLEDITNNIEHFVDSSSECRPSTSISEDTDGDSFGKTYVIQAQEKNCELQEIAADMNAQMFDFETPQTFLKPCNSVVQISNDDYIGKEAEISYNGDVLQTANQSASSNMNQLDQLDSSLPSTSKSSGHDVCLATVSNSKNNRKWDKKYFCICKKILLYCKKIYRNYLGICILIMKKNPKLLKY